MRYFMHLSFNGTDFCGWQRQPHAVSVQEKIEQALSLFLRQEVALTGAGRTDAGVHARHMVAHFDLETSQDCGWMKNKLNGILPESISVIKIEPVADTAHARFDAVSRTYKYYVTTEKDPFNRDFSWRQINAPDFELMNRAAQILLSTTDFTSFSKLHTDTKTNDCTVTEAYWAQETPGTWVFTITANRFLRNMVRAIVGTLMQVGHGKITVEQFAEIIAAKDRCSAGDSAPARGLFLHHVSYNI